MEDEKKDLEEVKRWKDILTSRKDDLDFFVKKMPKGVSDALVKDPDIGPHIAEVMTRSAPAQGQPQEAPGAGEVGRREAPKESAAAAAMRVRREREEREQREEQARKLSLHAKIARLDVGEKAKLARNGDKDARSILIKDGNKQVSLAVLENPRITQQEIEMIAASRNVTEDILRVIANNKDWMASYALVLNLVNNPKTPVTISLTLLSRLLTRDLRFLAKSKGIPEVIRVMARKMAQKRTV